MNSALDISVVLQDLLNLPLPERSYIAERLLVSLEDDGGEISPEQRAEFDARVQRRQSGENQVYSRDEVHVHIQSLLA